MGNTPSKPPAEVPAEVPAKVPLPATPWRSFGRENVWTDMYHDKELKELEHCFEGTESVQNANIVLLGPSNSGKSSFVCSVLSLGSKSVLASAPCGSAPQSYTTQLGVYQGRCGKVGNKVKLFDTMGLENCEKEGFNVNDIKLLVEGHIPKNYRFNPRSPISPSDKEYIPNPKVSDKTHLVVFCMQAPLVMSGSIPKDLRRKIGELQEEIKGLGIPRVLLLTHIDHICEYVSENITTTFRSKAVEEAVDTAGEMFKIPMAYIHPVKNYHKEPQPDTMTNVPLILALRHMLDIADDYVQRTYTR